jgi:hypothetical protein
MKETPGTFIEYSNWLSLIPLLIVVPLLPGVFVYLLLLKHLIAGLLGLIILIWLIYEMICNVLVRVEVEEKTIRVGKPLRKNSILSRKKHHEFIIKDEEWNQLYYHTYQGGTTFYFRKEQTAAYYFAADGMSKLIDELKKQFPEKKIADDWRPVDVVKALRKKFPERVL